MLRLPRPPLLGLDISPEAVRIVELSETRGRFRIEHADSEPLPPGAVNDREIQDVESVSRAIRVILDRSRIRTKSVASALPGPAVIVKIISLPAGLDEEGIGDQIRFEGGQYIPFSINAVNFDFTVLGPDKARKGYNQVLLVACKKETVEDRSAVLEEGGLKPKIIDVKQFVLWELYERFHGPQSGLGNGAVILVDIGGVNTNIHAFQNGQPVYSREHSFGVARLTDEIVRYFGIDLVDAQRMQRYGGLPQGYESAVRDPFIRQLAQEIFRTLDFFQASMPDIAVSSIQLFGAGANLPGLAVQLQNLTHFPVESPDPFAGMELGPRISKRFLESDGSSLATACGLAMRRFPA